MREVHHVNKHPKYMSSVAMKPQSGQTIGLCPKMYLPMTVGAPRDGPGAIEAVRLCLRTPDAKTLLSSKLMSLRRCKS